MLQDLTGDLWANMRVSARPIAAPRERIKKREIISGAYARAHARTHAGAQTVTALETFSANREGIAHVRMDTRRGVKRTTNHSTGNVGLSLKRCRAHARTRSQIWPRKRALSTHTNERTRAGPCKRMHGPPFPITLLPRSTHALPDLIVGPARRCSKLFSEKEYVFGVAS